MSSIGDVSPLLMAPCSVPCFRRILQTGLWIQWSGRCVRLCLRHSSC